VLDAIKERLQIDIHNPRRVILDELASPLDRLDEPTGRAAPHACRIYATAS
jgi:hypothetical protein